jgi:hypothetical protein
MFHVPGSECGNPGRFGQLGYAPGIPWPSRDVHTNTLDLAHAGGLPLHLYQSTVVHGRTEGARSIYREDLKARVLVETTVCLY